MKKTEYDKHEFRTQITISEDNIWTVLTNDKIIHAMSISLILIVITICWAVLFPKEVNTNIPIQTNSSQIKVGEYGR